jgi:hypothetical protein
MKMLRGRSPSGPVPVYREDVRRPLFIDWAGGVHVAIIAPMMG